MDSEEKNLQDPTVTHRLFRLITGMSDDERRTLLRLLEKGLLKGRCRRKYFRKPVRLPVAYANERHTYRSFIKDLSLGGVFILTSVPIKVGEEIRIVFNPGEKHSPVRILGTVARITTDGIGVKFISLNDDSKTALFTLASEGE